jgi:hypothetical protein
MTLTAVAHAGELAGGLLAHAAVGPSDEGQATGEIDLERLVAHRAANPALAEQLSR